MTITQRATAKLTIEGSVTLSPVTAQWLGLGILIVPSMQRIWNVMYHAHIMLGQPGPQQLGEYSWLPG